MSARSYRTAAVIAALSAVVRQDNVISKRAAARRLVSQLSDDTVNPALVEDLRRASKAEDPQPLLLAIIDEFKSANNSGSAEGAIMIVEDDVLTARVHADALDGLEREVLIARDSHEAQSLLRQHPVSIILLDLVLPDGDGRDLLVRMRATAASRSIPIIVITSRLDPATHAECFALGADVVISKPVDSSVLVALVAGQLDHAGQLRVAGRVDSLTGLPNRAALTDTIERLWPLARRSRSPMSIAMLDLDYFKAVNDTYGHDTGDVVLREAAAAIKQALRTSDIPARWGGEEFCVLLPDTDLLGGVRALTKALEAVRNLVFSANGEAFKVTFSAGIAAVDPLKPLAECFSEADRLLYLAKRSGRNRIFSIHDQSNPPRPRILLLEDDDSVADLVAALLHREGYDAVRYADGESALRASEKEYYVLAIVDIHVPLMNGYDLIARLRSLPNSAKLPVLVLTGSADEEDIVHGFEVGANDYVTKPFHNGELAARVTRLVARR